METIVQSNFSNHHGWRDQEEGLHAETITDERSTEERIIDIAGLNWHQQCYVIQMVLWRYKSSFVFVHLGCMLALSGSMLTWHWVVLCAPLWSFNMRIAGAKGGSWNKFLNQGNLKDNINDTLQDITAHLFSILVYHFLCSCSLLLIVICMPLSFASLPIFSLFTLRAFCINAC